MRLPATAEKLDYGAAAMLTAEYWDNLAFTLSYPSYLATIEHHQEERMEGPLGNAERDY